MGKERHIITMEITMKETSKGAKGKALGYFCLIRTLSTKESGRITASMEKANCTKRESCSLRGNFKMV